MAVVLNRKNFKFFVFISVVLTLLIILSLDNCERMKKVMSRGRIQECKIKRRNSNLRHKPIEKRIKEEIKLWKRLDAGEWPPERFYTEANFSEVDDGEQTLKMLNFSKRWPLPLSPQESGGKYILYDCHKQGCGGWGNRLMGILSAYFLAIISDRCVSLLSF